MTREEAIKAIKAWDFLDNDKKEILETLVPELKESEDEKIRKELITHCRNTRCVTEEGAERIAKWIAWLERQSKKEEYVLKSSKHEDILKFVQYIEKEAKAYELNLPNRSYDIYAFAKDILAWLEKQGEQKVSYTTLVETGDGGINALVTRELPTNSCDNANYCKVEPKFKVGDWIIFNENHNSIYQVERIDNYRYYLRHYLGGTLSVHFDNELIRRWTIREAKDGDVLVYNNSSVEIILLFKKWMNGIGDGAYSYVHTFDNKILFDDWSDCGYSAHPATKKQRDTLFAKIKEAGYE